MDTSVQGPGIAGARAFARLAGALHARTITLEHDAAHAERQTHTDELRELLRTRGPSTALELAERTGIPSKRVGALLGHDIATGRVVTRCDGTPSRTLIYAIAPAGRAGARS